MSDDDFEKTKKEFGGLGYIVVILGLLSLMFLGDARNELATGSFIGIALCVVTGIWLVIKPSVPIGVAAGVSLAILGIIDLLLVGEAAGLAFVAPLIDFGFAVRVFIGCSSYAKASTTAAGQKPEGDGINRAP